MTRIARSLAIVAALAAAQQAQAAIEEGYVPGEAAITTTWFALRSDTAQKVDRDYVAGMRPHHAGALSMSREYLADPSRSSPLLQALAGAIIVNQQFEIGLLDAVGRNLDADPIRLPFGVVLQPVATEGLGQAQRFLKVPMPSSAAYPVGPVNERDVLFAKAMITHHEAAVEMARGYDRDPAARNGFLGLLNVDIVTDQMQEIALMRRVIGAYPGDPDLIRPDPSMIHGMQHMGHGAMQPAAAAEPAAPASVRRRRVAPTTAMPEGHDHSHH